MKPEEKRKYDALFDQLQPADEKLGGDKVIIVKVSRFLVSKLDYFKGSSSNDGIKTFHCTPWKNMGLGRY